MAGGRLLQPVRRDFECEPADERRANAELELSQPGVRQQAGGDQPEQYEDVPAYDDAERPPERPEREAERPGRRVELWLGDRAKRVRIAPGIVRVLQLVARQPEPVRQLQVVSGSRFPVTWLATGEEIRVRVAQRGRCGQQRRCRADEGG
jgi:hypothetical protein